MPGFGIDCYQAAVEAQREIEEEAAEQRLVRGCMVTIAHIGGVTIPLAVFTAVGMIQATARDVVCSPSIDAASGVGSVTVTWTPSPDTADVEHWYVRCEWHRHSQQVRL